MTATLLGEQLLCTRVLGVLLREFANLTGNQSVKDLPIHVVLKDAHTASTGQAEESEDVTITIPRQFAGQAVVSTPCLILGLGSHEMGHLPDLAQVLRIIRQASERDPVLAMVFNLVEDVRIENRMMDAPVGAWLTTVRQAVLDEGNEESSPRTMWDLLWRLRFSNPNMAWEPALPLDEYGDQVLACHETFFVHEAIDEIGVALDGTPQDSLATASNILDAARKYGVLISTPPPSWRLQVGTGRHPVAGGRGHKALVGVSEGCISLPEGPRGERLRYDQEPVDREALQEGRRLARQIRQGWSKRRQGRLAVGIGKYDPRLDGRGIPPFSLPLAQRKSLPGKLLLLLDVSDSMYGRGCANLHIARTVTAAITLAARDVGGVVEIVPFWNGYTVAHSLEHALSVKGTGTRLDWLLQLLARYPGYDVLMVTDADVKVPSGWNERKRARTSIVLVPLPGSGPKVGRARELGRRVLPVNRAEDLPCVVALAARATMAQSA